MELARNERISFEHEAGMKQQGSSAASRTSCRSYWEQNPLRPLRWEIRMSGLEA